MKLKKIKNFIFLFCFSLVFSTVSKSEDTIHWKIDGKYLTPKCFVYEWMSSDNFEEFYKKYYPEIKNNLIPKEERYPDFLKRIGNFYVEHIPLEHVFKSSWGEDLSLTTYLQSCLSEKPKNKSINNGAGEMYEVIKNDDLKDKKLMCKILAPQISQECIDIKTVKITEVFSGSMPPSSATNTYGIFKLKNNKKIVLPLAFNVSANNPNNKLKEVELKKDFYKWLSAQTKYNNTNALYWDEDFRVFLKKTVNKIQLYLGVYGKSKKSDLLEIVETAFSGPPDGLVYSDNKRYLTISACKQSECSVKGLLWIDTKNKISVGVILHYFYEGEKYLREGNLFIFSKNIKKVKDLPDEFHKSLNQWKVKKKISHGTVRFLNSENIISVVN